jgi:hypothetical protein
MIQKDGKTYLTIEEARERSNKRIRENAKKFAEKVVKMEKESKNNSYV